MASKNSAAESVDLPRRAGVLLHPTSLPGPWPVGDLGPAAREFVRWASRAGFGVWQILPLGPPALSDSPYACLSTFAGNPLLISPEDLVADGLLLSDEILQSDELLQSKELQTPQGTSGNVDFDLAREWKDALLRRAFERFKGQDGDRLRPQLDEYVTAQQDWIEDWALFSALRRRSGGSPWWSWDAGLMQRRPEALEEARHELLDEMAYERFVQFLFARQWQRLKTVVEEEGMELLGDVPIYVALDSAEVWAHRDLFDLDAEGRPTAVAGVPPDYFSPTGQLWGNPLYRWQHMADDGYKWWIARLRAALEQCHHVRLDHFRAFAAYWQVPADHLTAEQGSWQPGPGEALFRALREALGDLPLIAEDLGEITPDVDRLRTDCGLPGMKVLHFAFGEDDSEHAPHRLRRDQVIYTGTHDNDTTRGWYESCDETTRRRFEGYVGHSVDAPEPHWDLIRLAFTSVAHWAVVPMQDILGLDSAARMNVPGVADGNWGWRLKGDDLSDVIAERVRSLVLLSGR